MIGRKILEINPPVGDSYKGLYRLSVRCVECGKEVQLTIFDTDGDEDLYHGECECGLSFNMKVKGVKEDL